MARVELDVYDSGAGWKALNGQPSIYLTGESWITLLAMHVMWWTLLSEVGEPEYLKEWLRVFDYTPPTQSVPNVTMDWEGDESEGGPYAVHIGWSLLAGYPVDIRLFQWNGGSWSLMQSDVVPEAAGGWTSDSLFSDGDEVYAEIAYMAHDGTALGPVTSTPAQVFTW